MFYESKFHLIDQHFRYNRPYSESARKMAQKYNFSQEETLVVYTENKFIIHEYFFLIVSAVFLFIMCCFLLSYCVNRCINKFYFIQDNRDYVWPQGIHSYVWFRIVNVFVTFNFDIPIWFDMISHIDIKRLTMEEYSDLIQQHHDFIKTGDRSRSNIFSRRNSEKTGDPERKFSFDQSQIIKCNEDNQNISGYQDLAFNLDPTSRLSKF